jgi:hypothetical protein
VVTNGNNGNPICKQIFPYFLANHACFIHEDEIKFQPFPSMPTKDHPGHIIGFREIHQGMDCSHVIFRTDVHQFVAKHD